eukprot:4417721-Lingulodinium_polyedra.AAC.1
MRALCRDIERLTKAVGQLVEGPAPTEREEGNHLPAVVSHCRRRHAGVERDIDSHVPRAREEIVRVPDIAPTVVRAIPNKTVCAENIVNAVAWGFIRLPWAPRSRCAARQLNLSMVLLEGLWLGMLRPACIRSCLSQGLLHG